MTKEKKKKEIGKNRSGRLLEGEVVRISGIKTVAVEVRSITRHPLYGKRIIKSKRYLVHDQDGKAEVGQIVSIKESKPISKRKRFVLVTKKT